MSIAVVAFVLAIAVGLGLLVWRVSSLEDKIQAEDDRDLVELRVYTTGDSAQADEALLRARGIPFLWRTRGARGGSHTVLIVPRARAQEAREALGLDAHRRIT